MNSPLYDLTFDASAFFSLEKSFAAGTCSHPKATNWVQCEICKVWQHCCCAGVSAATAKKADFHFAYC